MISLKGKVTLITGASRGIGAATAALFAEAGSDVALCYLEKSSRATEVITKIESLGRRVFSFQGNVGTAAVAREFVEQAFRQFGKIDVVVNNAGIWTYGEIGATPEKVWDETIDVNLKGVFNIVNAVVPFLKMNGGASIINVSSTAGQRGEAFHSHYAASKGGILAFTKSLAVELAPFKIRVNSVAPGWVDTEMNDEVFADRDYLDKVISAIPLKRLATAEDVAGSILFLASDLARHITGATINVHGGSVLN
jgi:3-oxoacyl-[acyl-carrier protein] reductase